MLVGFAIAVTGLMGCNKAAPTTTATALSGSGPQPGPIIDTSGDPTLQLTHSYDETVVANTSADPTKLDKRFFKKMSSAMLVDSGCTTNTPKKTYGLAKDVVVTVSFSDGTSYKVTIGDTSKEVTWTCTDAGGNSTLLVKGSDGEIPACMRTSMSRKLASMKASTGETGDLLVIKTEN